MHREVSTRQLAIVLPLVAVLLGAGLLLPATAVRADHETVPWATAGNIVPISPTISKGSPFVLTDDQGHVYVFYVNTNTSGGVANLRVVKLNATGGIIGSPELWFDRQVNDVANVVEPYSLTSAAMDEAGTLYVAWTRTGSAPAYDDIYVSKSLDGGNTWLAAVRVGNPNDGTLDQYPTIAVAPNGDVYVTWTTYMPSFWFYNIGFGMSTNGGSTFINQRNVSGQGAGGQALFDSIAFDSHGRAYVAYIGVNADFNTTLAYHINLTWSEDGSEWASPSRVTSNDGLAVYPSLAVDAQDRIHLAWVDYRWYFSVGLTVWYARSDDRGASWTPQRSIGDGTSSPSGFPALSVSGPTVMTVWVGARPVGGVYYQGLGYAISPDGGTTWDAERYYSFANPFTPVWGNITWLHAAPDANGTFWAAAETYDSSGTFQDGIDLLWWNGPPSAPVIQSVDVAGTAATIDWAPSPEADVTGYSVYRSTDATNWVYVGSVDGGTTEFTDAGLSNGTYWYAVRAIDTQGTTSHPSDPAVAQVGPSLEDQIAALQEALATLQSTTSADYAALQNKLDELKAILANVQTQQATQSTALLNTGLEVVIVVLLAVMLIMQFRRPKPPRPVMMMPQPAVAPPPPSPEEEL